MRYTTVIDLSEFPDIYRNHAARILYFHLALKAGYHDNDRDQVAVSIRRLASDTGITVSATRHALRILTQAGLLTRTGMIWMVTKWVAEQSITTRAKTKREMQEQILSLERQRQQQKHEKSYQESRQYDPDKALDNDAYRRLKARFGLKK